MGQARQFKNLVVAGAALVFGLAFGLGSGVSAQTRTSELTKSPGLTPGLDIVAASKAQIGITTVYDPSYVEIGFPGGDIPIAKGVCTDVVVRALRIARNFDLQREVHRDIQLAPSAYPQKWDLATRGADPHIDHRRVANLMVFFERSGFALPLASKPSLRPSQFKPGDLVAWDLDGTQLHIGVVSNRLTKVSRANSQRRPLIIHNIGVGTVEEDILFGFKIIGHYRLGTPNGLSTPQPGRAPHSR